MATTSHQCEITHLQMSQSKLGLNITSAKKLHSKCKLSVRRILKRHQISKPETLQNHKH